jgi:hypothetical protein
MTRDKDRKRLIRTRMKKTGESYSAAREHLNRTDHAPRESMASIAGMSDDAVRGRTGRTWPQWVRALDTVDASTLPHRDIAHHLRTDHNLSNWWAQMVTVGYERIKGLRDVGQRRDDAYEANKTRTVPVSVSVLYRAFADGRVRRRWLPGVAWSVRTATPDKSMRITCPDGTRVAIEFAARGDAKSRVSIQHGGLKSRSTADSRKAFWDECLDALAGLHPPVR